MDVDVILPWVDGGDPAHEAKRNKYLGVAGLQETQKGFQESAGSIRWECAGEIVYALHSIVQSLPFVRYIWVITDNQSLPFESLSLPYPEKIKLVDHTEIFRGHEDLLPCFNSAAISTAAVSIEGLADRAIITNDDIFFMNPGRITDFFAEDGAVRLRGTFDGGNMDYSTMWARQTRNAARLAGINQRNMISPAHCAQALDIALLKEFFQENPLFWRANLSYRFRDEAQFTISSLSSHLAWVHGMADMVQHTDCYHLAAANLSSVPLARLQRRVRRALNGRQMMTCINDLTALLKRMPDVRRRLDDHFGLGQNPQQVDIAAVA